MSGSTNFYTKGINMSTMDNQSKAKTIKVPGVKTQSSPIEKTSSLAKKKSKKKAIKEDDAEPQDEQSDSGSEQSKPAKTEINVRSIHSMKDMIGKTKTKITVDELGSDEQVLLGSVECNKYKITVENEHGSLKWNEWNTRKGGKPSDVSIMMSLGGDAKKMGDIHEVAAWKKTFGFKGESSDE